jgi:glycosyltransferase involved in cell wall biosynthesis
LKILFVHQNFPGQFVHLAAALRARGHDIWVITDTGNKKQIGYHVCRYTAAPRNFDRKAAGLIAGTHELVDRGEAVAKAAEVLRAQHNFVPDLIVGNPGWGETLFLKHVWPQAKMLVYAEFFYRPRGLDTDFDPEFQKPNLNSDLWVANRQMPHLMAIAGADQAISPTHWQASTFPPEYRARISVIHDGIDTDRIKPADVASVRLPDSRKRLRRRDEVLTFVNRNLEPYRGYHIFMRALPEVMAARPDAQVVIVGSANVSYSRAPPAGKTWRDVFLDEVKDRLDMSRVHFVNRVPYDLFIDIMRVSRVHAYLTYPFVLSWSMLEAMAAGALIVGSRTQPVEEVIKDGVNGRLVDFFDVEAWSRTLIESLADPARFDPLRTAARQTICDHYDLQSKCLPQQIALVEGMQSASR